MPFLWMMLAGCTSPTPALRIGLPLWTGYSPLYVAEAEGLLDPSRVQLIDCNSPAKMTRAYQLGNLDGVAVTTQPRSGGCC